MKLFEIGKNIKTLRVDNGLTQQELADKSGISRVTLGRLERGLVVSISVKTLDLILDNLGLEIEFKNKEGFGLPTLDEI
ncbi:XRE family transcriptional regulator [Thiospirochaeta perfilievii]|uniref:XRE family transcriptional regulator n=1 Tax=Thiospirochaeta perfilievii TaxID=252967 RepID=A0A5C1QE41_9SPIO|nr:helix-turn-helix transcriptional regulator [Thiospirochaeta perfilievii]QEN05648.1 XRE family transcriptional regulator [Thiospirochaeta perfilievii]